MGAGPTGGAPGSVTPPVIAPMPVDAMTKESGGPDVMPAPVAGDPVASPSSAEGGAAAPTVAQAEPDGPSVQGKDHTPDTPPVFPLGGIPPLDTQGAGMPDPSKPPAINSADTAT